jgi:integrase
MADGLIPVNPMPAVIPPKSDRGELAPPTTTQLKALMAAAVGTPWEIPLLIACVTGTRRSETLGIRREDLDLGECQLKVRRGLQRVPMPDGTRQLGFLEPKSKTSRRTVPLPAFAAERLRRYRVEQNERRMMLGPAWIDGDLVCERGDGAPLDPGRLHR